MQANLILARNNPSNEDPVDTLPVSSSGSLNHLLHGPLLPILIKLALPTVVVLFMTTVLSVAETYFVSTLGIHAIAAASMVVPVMMLMTMVSNGAIGGGVSSAIARARGANRLEDAQSLMWHALIIAIVAGAVFSLVVWTTGPLIYSLFGGKNESLHLALIYSNVLFSGAIASWVVVLMQSALRGAGNIKAPAMIMFLGVVAGLILSPIMITGWLGFPALGIAGAGYAQLTCNIGSMIVILLYVTSEKSNLRLKRYPFRSDHFKDILGVGLISTLNAFMTTLGMAALTAAAGVYGIASLAGYGIASRLELLMIPIMFGFGTAAITVVGTNVGAGNIKRAKQAALTNALFVGALVGLVGLIAAAIPEAWIGIFTNDKDVISVGGTYLLFVGPMYAFIAIILELYFAGQAASRIGWPLTAGFVRFGMSIFASYLVFNFHASLQTAFAIVALGIFLGGTVSLLGFRKVEWKR